MNVASLITRLSAELGNKNDLYRLGVHYYKGEEIAQDYAKAKKYLQKSADKRYPKALYYLGLMQRDGNDSTSDYVLALRYFELSKRDEERANEAIEMLERELFLLEKSEENAELLFKIGYMYANDNFIAKNYEKAIQYYKRSASYGNHHSKNQLGIAFAQAHLGLERNLDKILH